MSFSLVLKCTEFVSLNYKRNQLKKDAGTESYFPGTSIGHLMKKNYLPTCLPECRIQPFVYENT